MTPEQNYKDLYAKSSFSNRLNMTFFFIKENYKEILKYMLYFVLPFCLILSMFGDKTMPFFSEKFENYPELSQSLVVRTNGLIISIVEAIFGSAFIFFIYVKKYSEAAKQGLWSEVPTLGKLTVRSLVAFLLVLLAITIWALPLIFFVAFGGFALRLISLFIFIPLLIFIFPTTALFTPVYVLENRGVGYSIQKSFKYANKTWGSTFGIYLLLSIIASMLGLIGSFPYLIMEILKALDIFSGDGINTSTAFIIFEKIFEAISLFFTFFFSLIIIVGIMYQYGHAKDTVEHISEKEQIDNFDSL